MKTLHKLRILSLLPVFALAACGESTTDPDVDELTAAELVELSMLTDEGSDEIASELSSISNEVATARGNAGASEGRALNVEARTAFAEARAAYMDGDNRRALDALRAARRLVARALIATGGVPSVEDLIERLEDMLLTIDDEVVDDPEELRSTLEAIIAEAQALLDSGDTVGAAARAILGEQHLRWHRQRRDFVVGPDRARLEVAFANHAVGLAERLINEEATVSEDDEADAPERRNRWLAHAVRLLEKAEQALDNGNYPRAAHFAAHAQWSALKAVILPGGITEIEIRGILQVAEELHEQATASLPDDATEVQLRVLNRAGDLIEIGVRRLEAGYKRGVAALWRSATMSAWLL